MENKSPLLSLSRLLVILFLVTSYKLSARNDCRNPILSFKNYILIEESKSQDKNLLKGVWGRRDGLGEINISEVIDNGVLKATFYNPKLINIEKSTWLNSSGVLRIHILFREDNYPGSTFSLNYIAEKDVLVGVYFDAVTNESYTVTFDRVR
jgi:hypothetical protein